MVRFGDLAQSLVTRHQQNRLKMLVQQHSEAVTTGLASDIPTHLSGNVTRVAAIEHALTRADVQKIANVETQAMASDMQTALQAVTDLTSSTTSSFLNVDFSTSLAARTALAQEAKQSFSALVSHLNTQTAGRSLFSGAATDSTALLSAEDILGILENVVSDTQTAEGAITAIEEWFSAPEGFDAVAYQGSNAPISPRMLNETEQVSIGVQAKDPALKAVMSAFALAALSAEDHLSADGSVQTAMIKRAGTRLQTAHTDLVVVQSNLGSQQERIERAMVSNSAEVTALQTMRNALISIDSYDAATKLSEAQTQLETVYAVTVRNSQLSLAEFLR
jgi:flagellar hook-associated protein 3 FlgL